MKRLAILLCGLLLLASCNEIEDVHRLPKEFSIDGFTDVSELTYDELEKILNNSEGDGYMRDEIRRNGGIIIKASVKAENGEAFYGTNLWCSTNESDLPKEHSYIWNSYALPCLTNGTNDLLFYQVNQPMAESVINSTYYYTLEISTWNSEFPGFVDNCLEGDSYSNYAFSKVKSYTRPSVPSIFDCTIMAEIKHIVGNCYVKSQSPITQGGICYSLTKELPTVKDSVAYDNTNYEREQYEMKMNAWTPVDNAGSYYVRAFAASEGGIAYSPVWKVNIY